MRFNSQHNLEHNTCNSFNVQHPLRCKIVDLLRLCKKQKKTLDFPKQKHFLGLKTGLTII